MLIFYKIQIANSQFDKVLFDTLQYQLQPWAKEIVFSNDVEKRKLADSMFTKMLVRTIKNQYSFDFHFDSLKTISILFAPDSIFKIFTWNLNINDSTNIQRGAIQFKTIDGSLKLIPLIDVSFVEEFPEKNIGNFKNWIGAIYYKIIKTNYLDKDYYTLLGYDENNGYSNKKIIEVMYFDAKNYPIFGGDFFDFPVDKNKPAVGVKRFFLEYKKDAVVSLNFNEQSNNIYFSYLISQDNDYSNKATYIPEGSFEYFIWQKGKWVYKTKE